MKTNTPEFLSRLIWNNDVEKLVQLLREGLDIDHQFTVWCHSNHGLITHTLLSYCGELEGRHSSDAEQNLSNNSEKNVSACLLVRTLLDLGARVDVVAVAAALYRCSYCLRAVLEAGADPNATLVFDEKRTVTAIERCLWFVESVKVLIEYGASFEHVDFFSAAKNGCLDSMWHLVLEIPLRERNARKAIFAFLLICRSTLIVDRNVAQIIARKVWRSRRLEIWSFGDQFC